MAKTSRKHSNIAINVPSPASDLGAPFELKGEMSMMSVLLLLDTDTDRIADGLARKVQQAPEFFRNAPVIIELRDLGDQPLLYAPLVDALREHGMVPVGVRNASAAQEEAAREAGLALLSGTAGSRPTPEPAPEPECQPAARVDSGLFVSRPVRSGQQVFSPSGDLVVLASASAGSELLADGSIHVYGTLRGRALAGVNGDHSSRIICQGLEAELLSIAGNYQVMDDIDPALKGKPAQIYLEDERLVITAL